jgi:hypothetical protein
VKGVQKLLRSRDAADEPLVVMPTAAAIVPQPTYGIDAPILAEQGRIDVDRLQALRNRLAAALDS